MSDTDPKVIAHKAAGQEHAFALAYALGELLAMLESLGERIASKCSQVGGAGLAVVDETGAVLCKLSIKDCSRADKRAVQRALDDFNAWVKAAP